jgi:large subunit ribosomal protein L2
MATLKKFKPITPSQREMAVVTGDITKGVAPEKSLLSILKKKGGRNSQGVITTRHKGGGAKQKYRIIDFKRSKLDIPATVKTIEHDPNRTCNLALIVYADGAQSFILAPLGLNVCDTVVASAGADIKVGNVKQLSDIPVGTLVHNVELNPGAGGQIARSAGSYVQVMAKEGDIVLLRMPSGELRKVKANCKATIGQVEKRNLGKARCFQIMKTELTLKVKVILMI